MLSWRPGGGGGQTATKEAAGKSQALRIVT
ncbi:MAG: hypothetical protein QOH31_6403 [Verrucomicrobiota bacterium]|jgi:hypothetical protein